MDWQAVKSIGQRKEDAFMGNKLRPGSITPKSGQYRISGTKKEITGVKGKPLPPTPRRGQTYELVDATKNKSGRG
jgi:hypothetical protein